MAKTAMTVADQAVAGLRVTRDAGIVMVEDGQDRWLCRAGAWDDAVESLGEEPAVDESDDPGLAYGQLCGAIASPVASVIGTSRGDWETLVREAVEARLFDWSDAARYGVSEPARVMAYDTGEELAGRASEGLVAASEEAGPEGAVPAYRDADGVWQYLRPDAQESYRRMGHDVRIVYVLS